MTTELLAPLAKQRFVDSNGNALSGGKLFTYSAGTTTKLATYTDNTGGTTNANPIILNSRGECDVWIPPGTAYKFTLSPSTDTDPPTNAIWTVDQITVGGTIAGPLTISDASATDSPILGVSKTSTTIYTGDDNPLVNIQTAGTQDATLIQFQASGNKASFGVKRSTNNIVLKVGIGGSAIETMTWFLDGGINIGAPTGGDKGAGTLNIATGMYTNGIPGPQYFNSGPQLIGSSLTLNFSHSFATEPSFIVAELQNIVSELGFSVGAHVQVAPNAGRAANRGVTFMKNVSMITLVYGSDSGVFDVIRADTKVSASITPANWRLVFKAYQ